MPSRLQGQSFDKTEMGRDELQQANHPYDYPRDMDLKPLSGFHQQLLERILRRARDSREVIQRRFDSWGKIDETLQSFIPASEKEQEVKDADSRKPVSIVIPISYANMKTLLTFWNAAFLSQPPVFKYRAVDPADTVKALLLEAVVQFQQERAKMALALNTQWRDGFSYGMGIIAPVWETKHWKRTSTVRETFTSRQTGLPLEGPGFERRKHAVRYEGNRLDSINPYMYLPDPNVPIDQVQRGEYVGWLYRTNRFELLNQEIDGTGWFNAKYLSAIDGRSSLSRDLEGKDTSDNFSSVYKQAGGPVRRSDNLSDVIYMYVNLIPQEWKLGPEATPQKWFFAVAGDQVILKAQPLGLDHNMFPVVVNAPDFDGYSVAPVSMLETIYGMQEIVDFLMNSHIANVRKAVNDMIVYDPLMINTKDIKSPTPGKLIRSRRAGFGRDLRGSIFQLPVTDVTANHIPNLSYVSGVMRQIVGATDTLQGMAQQRGERVSAREAGAIIGSSVSRVQQGARITAIMAMQDLGYMLASHTQQMMSIDQYVQIVGRTEDELRDEFGLTSDVMVSPFDISVNFDVQPLDPTIPGAESVQTWLTVLQIMGQSEQLLAQYDVNRILQHIARLEGAHNLSDFRLKVQPTEQVMADVQAGNLVPAGEVV